MSYFSVGLKSATVGTDLAVSSTKATNKTKLADLEASDTLDLADIAAKGYLDLARIDAKSAKTTAEDQAYAARYDGAVKANEALIAAENSARKYEAQAEADTYNAKVKGQDAISAKAKAGADATDYRRVYGAKVATSKARAAASGFVLEGSPAMVHESLLQEVEFGAQRLVYAGDVKAARFTNEAKLLERQSEIATTNAKTARETGKKEADWSIGAAEIKAKAALTAGDTKAEGALGAATIKANAELDSASIKAKSTKTKGKIESQTETLKGLSDSLKGLTGLSTDLTTATKDTGDETATKSTLTGGSGGWNTGWTDSTTTSLY